MSAITWRNWGGNQRCAPAAIDEPRSVLEVSEAVLRAKAAGQTVRAVGSGHSFTPVACTNERMLVTTNLDRLRAVDPERGTVTVEAGIRLWQLNDALAERGLALANLGDINRQTVSGAISTGTHGTGAAFGGLATFVRGIEMVTADGEVVQCSFDEEPELFECARVSLGSLGIITAYTLAVVPAFRLHAVEQPGKLAEVLANLDADAATNDHYEFYWFPHTDACQTKANNRTDAPAQPRARWAQWRDEVLLANGAFGAVCNVGRVFPRAIPSLAKVVGAAVGRTEVTDRSDHVFCSPRNVRFVEMEQCVPAEHLKTAFGRVQDVIEREGLRVSFPIEVRFAAADDIPLSTASGRASAYIAIHMHRGTPYERYFRAVEEAIDDLGARPHWGKMHWQTAATLATKYPQWERFAALRAKVDPDGRFSTPYLDRVLGRP